MRRPRILLAAVALLAPGPAAAQSGAVRLGVVSSRVERIAPVTGTRPYTAVGFTLDGAFGLGPATLGVRYLQSPLSSDSTPEKVDLVEGEALLWFTPVRWADLGIGPHLRAYAQGGGTERWVLWEIRARGRANLLGPRLSAYAEGWTVIGGSVGNDGSLDKGRGLEGGLRLLFGRLPFAAHLRYRVERLELGDGARRETLEQLGLAIGVGRR